MGLNRAQIWDQGQLEPAEHLSKSGSQLGMASIHVPKKDMTFADVTDARRHDSQTLAFFRWASPHPAPVSLRQLAPNSQYSSLRHTGRVTSVSNSGQDAIPPSEVSIP